MHTVAPSSITACSRTPVSEMFVSGSGEKKRSTGAAKKVDLCDQPHHREAPPSTACDNFTNTILQRTINVCKQHLLLP